MRTLDIIKTANSNLFRAKLRTFLTVSAVFIGALTLLLTIGVGSGLKTYVDEQLASAGAENLLVIMQKTDNNPLSDEIKTYDPQQSTSSVNQVPFLDKNDLDKIAATKHITKVSPDYMVTPLYVTSTKADDKLVLSLSQSVEGLNQPLKTGRLVDNRSAQAEVTLPPAYVKRLGFTSDQAALGQIVTITFSDVLGKQFSRPAKVVGVQEKSVIMANSMLANEKFIKQVYQRSTEALPSEQPEQYVSILAYFDPKLSDQQVVELKKSLSDKGLNAMTVEDQLGQIKSVIDAIITFLMVFGVITLLAATFGIVNTLLMAVQERTREIGLMKALGMSRGKIFTIFSVEALLIGFWGSLLALLVALVIGYFGSSYASSSFLKDFEGLELISYTPANVLMVVGAVMLIALLAAALPARRASKLDPIEALRYE